MSETEVRTHHFLAKLTDQEYIDVRTKVAIRMISLQDWITEAIQEKLRKDKEDNIDNG